MTEYIVVSDMNVGDAVEGFYILKEALIKTTASGRPFLSGSISDMSGKIEIIMWDYSGPITGADSGKTVKIRGEVSEYRGLMQLQLSRIRLALPDDKFDPSMLVETAPIDVEDREAEIKDIIASMEDADYRKLAEEMYRRHRDAFVSIPAAKSVHHGFLSGLLMHTSNMLRAADSLSYIYDEVIDRSLLLAGTLLHDFAKEREFVFSDLGIVTDYSVKGQLLGHLVMGAQEVAELAKELGIPEEKSLLLQHMLLSHHGEPEYGAAVVPACAEAELLYYIDSMDSRMEIYAETFRSVPKGEFSGRIFALDKKIFNHK